MKKERRKCLHCLCITEDWNWDHVFPKSWYPQTTPPNLEKWQVPACKRCNSEYGKLEDDLMIRIGLCLDPNDPRCSGITQKAIRAVSPQYATDEKDKAARAAKLKEILKSSLAGREISDENIYPGMGNRWGKRTEDQLRITIPEESLRRLNEKIIKGIFLLEDERYVEPPFKISFWAVHDEGAATVKETIDLYGQVYAREPGIIVKRAVAPEDALTSVYLTEIWGQFKMYGSVEK